MTSRAVQASVAIYPFEGGSYFLSGDNGAILDIRTNKTLKGGVGSFSITLAPGGPLGVNANPSWAQILTPMSLVVIGMTRGEYKEIVMVGNVRSCQEAEVWNTGKGVQRGTVITGTDFGQFFAQASYYNLTFLAGAVQADAVGAIGLSGAVSQALTYGTPNDFGAAWYSKIMAGPGSIMANLTFPFAGASYTFYDLVAQYWQPFDGVIDIPMGDFFMISEGSWLDKFTNVFPFPYYEFFITTAEPGFYSGTDIQTPANIPAKQTLSLPGYTAVSPQIVARINPLPWTKPGNAVTGIQLPPLTMETDKWLSLPQFFCEPAVLGPIQSAVSFSEAEVANFFLINPTWLSAQSGISNASNALFAYTYASLVDVGSIHRYGYRPVISEILWFSDQTGSQAQANAAKGVTQTEFDTLVAELAFRLSSYHEPAPLMAQAAVTTQLRPDIQIGCVFNYMPFKYPEEWQFYIEGVSHHFSFGGNSSTTLTLTRGLPTKVYEDSTLLTAIHTGNSNRVNGVYAVGNDPGLGAGLQPVNFSTVQTIVGDIAQVFSKPQYALQDN